MFMMMKDSLLARVIVVEIQFINYNVYTCKLSDWEPKQETKDMIKYWQWRTVRDYTLLRHLRNFNA